MKCSNCGDKAATHVCHECGTVFCHQCDQQVHSLTIFKAHSRIEANTASIGTCPEHSGKLELLMCKTCGVYCCPECVCSGQKHSGHDFVSHDTAYPMCKAEFMDSLPELRAIASVSCTLETLLEEEFQRRSAQYSKVQDNIAECFECANAAVAKRTKELLADTEHRFGANSRALCETIEEYNAAEETSRNALAHYREPSTSISEDLYRIGLLERSMDSLAKLSDKTYNKVIPESYTIKFNQVIDKEKPQQKKEDERESDECGDSDRYKDSPIVTTLSKFGVLSNAVNGNSSGNVFKMERIKRDDGTEVTGPEGTHVRLTWDTIPSCYTELAKTGKIVFTLKLSTEEEPTPKTVYSGPDTTFLCKNLSGEKIYKVTLFVTNPDGGHCFWKGTGVPVCPWEYRGKWRVDCPRVRVSAENPAIVSARNGSRDTAIADTPLTPGRVNKWKIRLICSSDRLWDWVGVAPEDINLNGTRNERECGWYLNTYMTTLYSGPPFWWGDREYGDNRRGVIPQGSVVGVVMDMNTGSLSFSVDGKDLGVAYTGLPMDKPLYPVVILNGSRHKMEILSW